MRHRVSRELVTVIKRRIHALKILNLLFDFYYPPDVLQYSYGLFVESLFHQQKKKGHSFVAFSSLIGGNILLVTVSVTNIAIIRKSRFSRISIIVQLLIVRLI